MTLANVTLVLGDSAAARLGNVALGDGVTLDASAVTAEGALYAAGVAVADGAAVAVVAGTVQAGQTLVTGITLDEGADIAVDGLSSGIAYAVADDALVLLAKVAKIGDTYYDTLQDAIDAAQNGDVVEVVADITLPTGGLEIVDKTKIGRAHV